MADKKETGLRYVRVFIVDPDLRLPADKRLLYSSNEMLTDSTDEELFFASKIQEKLELHNHLRETTLDKKASEKTGKEVYLELIRIRDLKMVVTTLAEF